MIDSKTLRVGNLVNLDGEVVKLTITDIWQGIALDCDPITLTQDHLKKLGYVKTQQYYKSWCMYKNGLIEIQFMYRNGFRLTGRYNCVDKRYLHELQNVLFEVTGEEIITDNLHKSK